MLVESHSIEIEITMWKYILMVLHVIAYFYIHLLNFKMRRGKYICSPIFITLVPSHYLLQFHALKLYVPGQSFMKPLYHCWIVSSSYLVFVLRNSTSCLVNLSLPAWFPIFSDFVCKPPSARLKEMTQKVLLQILKSNLKGRLMHRWIFWKILVRRVGRLYIWVGENFTSKKCKFYNFFPKNLDTSPLLKV